MSDNAIWLSGKERVTVIRVDESGVAFREPVFQCRRVNGASLSIDRHDILLDDEARLVNELALIMTAHRAAPKSTRYAPIIKILLEKKVPFSGPLKRELVSLRNPSEQLLLDLPAYV